MELRHFIDELVFDISFDLNAMAFAHQDGIRDFVCDGLLPVIAEVCDEHAGTETVLRLDKVEIDIGDMPEDGFQAEMARRLREKLGDLLREKGASASAEAGATHVSRQRAERDQLERFLRSGSMPWQSDTSDAHAHEQILDRLIDAGGTELSGLLMDADDRAVSIRRLVNQFSERHLADVLHALLPSGAATALDLIDDFRRILEGCGLTGTAYRDSVRLIWMHMIEAMTAARGAPMHSDRPDVRMNEWAMRTSDIGPQPLASGNRPEPNADRKFHLHDLPITVIVKQIAQSQGLEQARLLAMMASAAQGLERDNKIKSAIAGLLASLQDNRAPIPGAPRPTAPTVELPSAAAAEGEAAISRAADAAPAALRHRVAQAVLAGDATAIRDIWGDLLRTHPELLREALRHYGARADVRQRLVAGFPATMLMDIAQVLEARAAALMAPLVEDPAPFRLAAGALEGVSPETWARRLWEAALAHLLATPDGGFEPLAFVGALLEQMAGADRARYPALVRAWRETAAAGAIGGLSLENLTAPLEHTTSSAHQASTGLSLQESTSATPAAAAERSAALLRGYDLRDMLRQRLLSGAADEHAASGLGEMIDTLAAQHPAQLQRMYNAMRSGELSLASLRCSDEEWRRLVAAFMSMASPSAEHAEFLRAMDKRAQRAANTADYFRQVLDDLLHERPLEDAPSLIRTMERMLAQRAPALGELLASSVNDHAMAARLVQLLPERLLTRILLLLRPAEHYAVQRCADSVADAFCTVHARVAPGRVTQLKWQFIFSYLFGMKRLFSHADFVRGMTDYLAVQSGVAEAGALRDTLKRRIASDPAISVPPGALQNAMSASEGEPPGHTAKPPAPIEHAKMLPVLVQAWRKAVSDGELAGLARILEALPEQDQPPKESGLAADDAADERSAALLHGYDLHETLRQRLLSGAAAEHAADGLDAVIDVLAAQHPAQLQRVYHAMRSGELSLAALRCNDQEWRRLMTTFMSIASPSADRTEFLRAVDAHAEHAASAAHYFRQVLDDLLHERPIDLEAIAAHGSPAVETAATATATAPAAVRPDDALIPETPPRAETGVTSAMTPSIEERPTAAAAGGEAVAPRAAEPVPASLRHRLAQAILAGDATGMRGIWEDVLRTQPELLCDALRHYAVRAEVRQRLAAGFPGTMLRDIAQALEPTATALIAPLLDDPASFRLAAGAAAGGSLEQWTRGLWETVLACLVTTARGRFEPQALVGALLEQMAGGDRTRYPALARAWREAASIGMPHQLPRILEAVLRQEHAAELHRDALRAGHANEPGASAAPDQPGAGVAAGGDRPQPAAAGRSTADFSAEAWSARNASEEQALKNFLDRDSTVGAAAPDVENAVLLIRALERMLAEPAPALRALLASAVNAQAAAARLVQLLPERLLTRILLLLLPAEHYAVQHCADSVADAFCTAHARAAPGSVVQLKWQFIFGYLFDRKLPFAQADFVRGMADYLAVQSGVAETGASRETLHRHIASRLAGSASPEARKTELVPADLRPQAPSSHGVRRTPESAREPMENIYILNAGQVLAAPYLPRLFSALNLTQQGAFVDRIAAERAVHLLQFMVNETTDSPEYQLVLNKILCGVAAGIPIAPEIEISAHEKSTVEGLIQGMIQNWKTIGNTSVKGLRESFLQRAGQLRLQDDAWQLQVQPGTFDMLLDRLPWSFSVIKHPWMERAVHVTWR